jgi:hypothetical protein
MQGIDSEKAAGSSERVWRDLAGLGAEAIAIGLAFSLILGLAVFLVARGAPPGNFAAAATQSTGVAAS